MFCLFGLLTLTRPLDLAAIKAIKRQFNLPTFTAEANPVVGKPHRLFNVARIAEHTIKR